MRTIRRLGILCRFQDQSSQLADVKNDFGIGAASLGTGEGVAPNPLCSLFAQLGKAGDRLGIDNPWGCRDGVDDFLSWLVAKGEHHKRGQPVVGRSDSH